MTKKNKNIRPNPFGGAEDIYLTKTKIVVTKTTNTRTERGYTQVTKTKYYEQNEDNMRRLKKVTPSVRIGRKGSNYRKV